MRSCIFCREKKEKRALLRLVRTVEGNVAFDPTGKQNGRGAYVCMNEACIESVKNKAKVDRALAVNADELELEKAYANMREFVKTVKEKEVR